MFNSLTTCWTGQIWPDVVSNFAPCFFTGHFESQLLWYRPCNLSALSHYFWRPFGFSAKSAKFDHARNNKQTCGEVKYQYRKIVLVIIFFKCWSKNIKTSTSGQWMSGLRLMDACVGMAIPESSPICCALLSVWQYAAASTWASYWFIMKGSW